MNDIKGLIDKCIEDPSFKEGRDKARAETWVPMGEGTKKCVDFVLKKYNDVLAKYAAEEKRAAKQAKAKAKSKKTSKAKKGA